MTQYIESIIINTPVEDVYKTWTEFEKLADIFSGVKEIKQLSEDKLHWNMSLAGVVREFETKITDQEKDNKIIWESITKGIKHSGQLYFVSVDRDKTKVDIIVNFIPEDLVEQMLDKVGALNAGLKYNLQQFKKHIESKKHIGKGESKMNKVKSKVESKTGYKKHSKREPHTT